MPLIFSPSLLCFTVYFSFFPLSIPIEFLPLFKYFPQLKKKEKTPFINSLLMRQAWFFCIGVMVL